jgi:phosphatidate phosphatase APP1
VQFSGEVFNSAVSKHVPGVRVYLRGEKQTFSALTDGQGRFIFENIPPGVYEAAADVPLSAGPIKIDLTQAWCAHRTFLVK